MAVGLSHLRSRGTPHHRPRTLGLIIRPSLIESSSSGVQRLHSVRIVDIDGDGLPDLAHSRNWANNATTRIYPALEGFAGNRVEMIAAVVQAIADGKLDISRGGRLIAVLAPEALEERIAKFELMIEEQNK